MEADVRGIPLHYEEAGSGRPFIVFHGWGGDHRHPRHHLEPLFAAREGWRRIYPDMPGMGRTPAADWIETQDQMLEIAVEFLDTVAPGQRPVVGGGSWGAYIALGIAHRRAAQLDGLMLTAPLVEADRGRRNVPERQVLHQDPELVAGLTGYDTIWARMAVLQTPESLENFRAAVLPGLLAHDESFLERMEAHYPYSFPLLPLPEPMTAPAVVIAGRQDPAVGYEAAWPVLASLPRATFAVLDRAGHGLESDQRLLYRALVNEWLDRVEEAIG